MIRLATRAGPSSNADLAPSAATAAVPQSTPEEQIEKSVLHPPIGTPHRLAFSAFCRTDLAFFEELIIDLLVKMGYGGSRPDAATQLGRSGDGGVDGVINEDRLGLDRVYVQAKRYSDGTVVGRPAVQNFVGSSGWHGRDKGGVRYDIKVFGRGCRIRSPSTAAGHLDRWAAIDRVDDRARRGSAIEPVASSSRS